MDAVIPFIHSDNADIELLFALRTLSSHAKHIDRVFIIGDQPDFTNEKVVVYPFEQKGTKDYCIAKKTEFACTLDQVSENFLFMNDDHFFTKDISEDYPYYYRNETIKGRKNNIYKSYIDQTMLYLESLGKQTRDFDVHCPIIYNKKKFLELTEHWNSKKNYLVKSMYGNCNHIEGVEYHDCKIRKFGEMAFKNECFSIYDIALYNGTLKWLGENYTQPSRYEKETKFGFKVIKGFKDSVEQVKRDRNTTFFVDNNRAMDFFSKGQEHVRFIGFETLE